MTQPPTLAVDWEGRYRAPGTPGWQRPGINPALTAWRAAGELKPCRILIPGAGRSAEPGVLAGEGFAVTVVDAALSAVAFQAPRVAPAGQALAADLFDWAPEQPFDAIYDQTCLCAIDPGLWDAYAHRLHGWLRPGGRLFVLFMQTGRDGGPPFHCDLGRMRALFAAPDWQWPATLPAPVPHSPGQEEQPAVLLRN
jgi:hypothetical protein